MEKDAFCTQMVVRANKQNFDPFVHPDAGVKLSLSASIVCENRMHPENNFTVIVK